MMTRPLKPEKVVGTVSPRSVRMTCVLIDRASKTSPIIPMGSQSACWMIRIFGIPRAPCLKGTVDYGLEHDSESRGEELYFPIDQNHNKIFSLDAVVKSVTELINMGGVVESAQNLSLTLESCDVTST